MDRIKLLAVLTALTCGGGSVSPLSAAMADVVIEDSEPKSYAIKGRVVDELREPLPGASVRIKGSTTGTVTDMEGNFSFNVKENRRVTIVVSFVGLTAKELQVVPGGKPLYIELKDGENMLDELIVSGFQTISRERSTGSAVIINSEKLEKVQAADLASKLEGIAPGLTIYNDQMSIRGTSSFAVDATPLLVIDGQPATGLTLDDVDPEIIENVTVLKDAAATSLYGVRASNGVIVITTKRSRDEKVNVNVSLNYYMKPVPSLDYQHYASTSDIIDLEREYLLTDPEYIKDPSAYFGTLTNKSNAAYMSQVDMLYYRLSRNELTEADVNARLDALRGNDYRKEYRKQLQHMALTQDYNLSVTKGGERYSMFASVRYRNNGQYNTFDKRDRVSFYLKNDLQLASWLKITAGADVSLAKSSFSQAEGLGETDAMPYDRLYNEDGTPAYRYLYNQVLAEQVNAMEGLNFMGYNAIEESGYNKQKRDNTYMKYFLQSVFNITKDLGLELKVQYEKRMTNTEQFDEAESYKMRSMVNEFASTASGGGFTYNIPRGGHLYATNAHYNYYNMRGQFNYSKEFAEKHDFTALLGGELRQDKYRSLATERYGYDSQRLTSMQVDWLTLSRKGVVGQLYSGTRMRSENTAVADVMHRYASAYFNAGYTYDSRYAANFSVRVEQADLFGSDPKYRYRPLWSFGLSWNASKEEFLKDVKWLNMLKLRCTYGITGNVDQSSSPYLLAYFMSSSYTGSNLTEILTPPNASLRWEKTSTFNFGIDSRLFNRLSATLDVYRRYSSDLLVDKIIDPSLGFDGRARANNGEMQNTGVEMSFSYDWIKRREMSLTASLTAAYNKNEIKKVSYEPTDAMDMMTDPASNFRLGDTFNSLYAYRYAGLTATGDPSVYNENGEVVSINPVRNIGAVVAAGQLAPKWNGALSLDFRWKELSVFVKAVYYTGHSLRNDAVTLYDAYNPIVGGAIGEDIVNRWTPEHTDTDIPAMALHTNTGERNYHWKYSDVNVCSASFIKLRNIGVAYTLPSRVLEKIKMKGITVKAQVDNACYWAANKHGIDPEAFKANDGMRNAAQMPTYILGLNVKF